MVPSCIRFVSLILCRHSLLGEHYRQNSLPIALTMHFPRPDNQLWRSPPCRTKHRSVPGSSVSTRPGLVWKRTCAASSTTLTMRLCPTSAGMALRPCALLPLNCNVWPNAWTSAPAAPRPRLLRHQRTRLSRDSRPPRLRRWTDGACARGYRLSQKNDTGLPSAASPNNNLGFECARQRERGAGFWWRYRCFRNGKISSLASARSLWQTHSD